MSEHEEHAPRDAGALRSILAVASLAFRESSRNRVLHALVGAMLLVGGVSYVIAWAAGGDADPVQRFKLVADIQLTALVLLGTLASIFLGTDLIYKEVERRTIYTVLARPVSRTGFLLGKYLGLLGVVGVALAVMGAFVLAFLGVAAGQGVDVAWGHLALAIAFVYVELAVVVAVALLFSVAAHPIEGAVFAFIVALTGHVTGSLNDLGRELTRGAGDAAPSALAMLGQKLLYAAYVLLPNLENFDLRGEAVWGLPLEPARLLGALAYAVLYVAIVLALASLVFRRKVL